MKKLVVFFLVALAALTVRAQQKLTYAYDAAGNRVSRTIVLGTRNAGVATEQTDSVFFEESLAETSVKIYPNPVQNELTIRITGYENGWNGEFAVYSISGAMLMHRRLQGETTSVDMSRQLPGTYILHIVLKGERSVWKIMKQ
jgi:YD repeat-containing protein